MSDIRDDRQYTKNDDWLKAEDGKFRMGISDYAQDNLGEVVNVELIKSVGDRISKGEEIAYLESIKATADILAPFDGTIIAVNDALLDENMEYTGRFNDAPYDEWMFVIEPEGAPVDLMSSEEYSSYRE